MNMLERTILKELREFTNEVIRNNREWCGDHYAVDWYKVDSEDQNKIIAFLVELDGKDFLAIGENEERYRDDILAKMIGLIKRGDLEAEIDFAESVRRAVHSYYRDKGIAYLEELTNEYTHEKLRDAGYCVRRDQNHGDYSIQRI